MRDVRIDRFSMKIFLKLFAGFVLLILFLVAAAYFYLTNPGVQKRIVDQNLPEGSSVASVHVTLNKIELSGVKLAAEDGTQIAIAELRGDFSPMAAIFSKTVRVGDLLLSGVKVDLPEPVVARKSVSDAHADAELPDSEPEEEAVVLVERVEEDHGAEPSWDVLYQIGESAWLLDIKRIQVDGSLTDGRGGDYRFELTSSAIQPGLETKLSTALTSRFPEPKANGLQSFKAGLSITFLQKITGGFESFRAELGVSAKDSSEGSLVAIDQVIDFEIDEKNKTAKAIIQLNANLKKPEVFVPELNQFGSIAIMSDAEAQLEGEQVTLIKADFTASSDGREVVVVELKKQLVLGGAPNLEGELLDFRVVEFPSEWLKPWLPSDLTVVFAPLSIDASVVGADNGVMHVQFNTLLQLNDLQVEQGGVPMIDELDFSVMPSLTARADESVEFSLSDLTLADAYGKILTGNLTGRLEADAGQGEQLLEGVLAEADVEVKLQPLVNQPVLTGRTSVMSGELSLRGTVDGSAAMPLRLDAQLTKLRARGLPGQTQDYAVKLDAANPVGQQWQAMVELFAGRASSPATDLRITGSADLESQPLEFEIDITSEQIRQSDLLVLAEAFKPAESEPTPSDETVIRVDSSSQLVVQQQAPAMIDNRPAWADLNGKASVQIGSLQLNPRRSIDQIKANLVVSEPLLELSNLSAEFGDGFLAGAARVDYSKDSDPAYTLNSNIEVQDLDPAIFSSNEKMPLSGSFDGELRLVGSGNTMEAALDRSDSSLHIVSDGGVLTAFEFRVPGVSSGLIGGLGGIAGGLLKKVGDEGAMVAAAGDIASYFSKINYSKLEIQAQRTEAEGINIETLEILSPSLRITGPGVIGPSPINGIADQPMNIDIELAVKDALGDSFGTLRLIEDEPDESGYFKFVETVPLRGSINRPDFGALGKMLWDATKTALSDSDDDGEEPVAQSERSEDQLVQGAAASEKSEKEGRTGREKTIDEVEMGIELINSFFGKE